MPALVLDLELLEPVLATQPEAGEPNSAESFRYLPGSMLRGALIKLFRAQHKDFDVADGLAQKLFFDGTVCFLNAYPAHPVTQERMLPKPLSWFVKKTQVKNAGALVQDFAVRDPEWDQAAKAPGGDFFSGGDTVTLVSPALSVTVHNASDDRTRKNANVSQVFRYLALAAGQQFKAVIVTDPEHAELLRQLQSLLQDGILRVGGSQSAGYGTVRIVRTQPDDAWSEYTPGQNPTGQVIVTCMSDVILRQTENGQVGTDLAALVQSNASEIRTFARVQIVGGFNRTWGLPLIQDWAIQAGSVFVLPAASREAWQALAKHGIGERRAEGFGRIAVDLQTRETFSQARLEQARTEPPSFTLSRESLAIARRMSNRRYRAERERAMLHDLVHLTEGNFANLPRPAQLARAQLVARAAWEKTNLQLIVDHFEKNLSRLAKRDWDYARLGKDLLRDWILDRVQDAQSFKGAPDAPRVANVQPDVTGIEQEMTARLIEGVLKEALKQAQRDKEGVRQ